MPQFFAHDFVTAAANLAIAHANAVAVANGDETDQRISKRDEIISSEDCGFWLGCLNASLEECQKISLEDSAKLLKRLSLKYSSGKETWGALATDSWTAIERITDEMEKLVFVHVPTNLSGLYTEDFLFGKNVAEKFPKTIDDIQEAGNVLRVAAIPRQCFT